MSQEHILKTQPAYYDAIKRGEKMFEVRRDDRGFQKGDILVLQRLNERWNPHEVETDINGVARHEMRFRIKYILTGGQFGLAPGYVVMQLEAE